MRLSGRTPQETATATQTPPLASPAPLAQVPARSTYRLFGMREHTALDLFPQIAAWASYETSGGKTVKVDFMEEIARI